jgi:hypothetical protein
VRFNLRVTPSHAVRRKPLGGQIGLRFVEDPCRRGGLPFLVKNQMNQNVCQRLRRILLATGIYAIVTRLQRSSLLYYGFLGLRPRLS